MITVTVRPKPSVQRTKTAINHLQMVYFSCKDWSGSKWKRTWKDGSVVRTPFRFPALTWRLTTPVTPFPRDLTPCSGHHKPVAHIAKHSGPSTRTYKIKQYKQRGRELVEKRVTCRQVITKLMWLLCRCQSKSSSKRHMALANVHVRIAILYCLTRVSVAVKRPQQLL